MIYSAIYHTNNMNNNDMENLFLGIEFGSTRIKGVIIDKNFKVLAVSSHEWSSKFEDGYWSYNESEITDGLADCYLLLKENFQQKYGVTLKRFNSIGVSGMMHGYLPLDRNGKLLTRFRTWRNTTAGEAAEILTQKLHFNMPMRWSAAHLYQAILNGENHIPKIDKITTLSGYVHFLLTGRHETGVCEASGIFPLSGCDYDKTMIDTFNALAEEKGYSLNLSNLLPKVLRAGEKGAVLTAAGAKLIDPDGDLEAGIPLCPPEGDAASGMVCTNSILPGTGNISAGTSIFSMLVLDKPIKNVYPQIDITATPDGLPVAMIHSNNGCSELDFWVRLFGEFAELIGKPMQIPELCETLYRNSLSGREDCGGMTEFNFLAAEPIADVRHGIPMFMRLPESRGGIADFFRTQIYSVFAALRMGNDILLQKEKISAKKFCAHGGLFKVSGVAQQYLADGLNTSVTVMDTAGEGGAWGVAVLAAYMDSDTGKTLAKFLSEDVFKNVKEKTLYPSDAGVCGFNKFMEGYIDKLKYQRI